MGTTSIEKSELLSKLLTRAGIEHEVLNAKQHAKEAQIVAQAGRLKAVTIATNMAGRGTDIVLGGNFEIMANNELFKEGIEPAISRSTRNASGSSKTVRINATGTRQSRGTRRASHRRNRTPRSRRIDNQLRGRVGRQGDPGSSKFFLSLDDDLMRIFGSERIASIMDGLARRKAKSFRTRSSHEPSATRRNGLRRRNFDIRKHLKEYDDVMNLQRKEIYGLRQRILKGEDIKDEIMDQLAGTLESIIFKYTAGGKYPDSGN